MLYIDHLLYRSFLHTFYCLLYFLKLLELLSILNDITRIKKKDHRPKHICFRLMPVLQLPRTCDIPLNKYIRRLLKQILYRQNGIKEISDINHTLRLQYELMDP